MSWLRRLVELIGRPSVRCGAMSPEGMFCDLRYGHDGLHVPTLGNGWAWGGDSNTESKPKECA